MMPLAFYYDSGTGYDPDAQDWFDRVVANGDTVSDPTKTAANTLVLAAKANGYWTKINRWNLIAGNGLNAALVPLKIGAGDATDGNTAFVSGDYSEAGGLTGDGSTKVLDTGILISDLTPRDVHLSFSARAGLETSGSHVLMGGWNGIGGYPGATLDSFNSARRTYIDTNYIIDGESSAAESGGLSSSGHYIGSQLAAYDTSIYKNGSLLTQNTTGGTGTSYLTVDAEVAVFALGAQFGPPSSFSAATCIGYSVGSGLTSGDVANYSTDLAAFNSSLGR